MVNRSYFRSLFSYQQIDTVVSINPDSNILPKKEKAVVTICSREARKKILILKIFAYRPVQQQYEIQYERSISLAQTQRP